jgi:hypothetical protein
VHWVRVRRTKKHPLEEQELPGMPPKSKKLSAAQKMQREIEEYAFAMQGEAGPLVIRSVAARVLGLSTQRVHQLVDAGRLRTWDFFDATYVSLPDVLAFQTAPRSLGGRPRKEAA